MKRNGNVIIYLLLVCFILSGCRYRNAPSPAALDLAASINIHCRHGQANLSRQYTDENKMDVILHYLHKISPQGLAKEDPELLQGDFCTLVIQLSDGTQRTYRIKGNSFFSVDYRPWQTIDAEPVRVLLHLIAHIPSDPLAPNR